MVILKVISLALVLIFSSSFISCSGPSSQYDHDRKTLRSVAEDIDNTVDWTADLEVKEKKSFSDNPAGIAPNIRASVQNIVLSEKTKNIKVSPMIEGFGPVKISVQSQEAFKVADSFCRNLIKGESSSALVKKEKLYELTVFLYNLEEAAESGEFDSYIIGSAFECEDYIQFPVRLYFEDKSVNYATKPHIDVYIYISKSESVWNIIQFDFA